MNRNLLPLFLLLSACAPETDDLALQEAELDREEALLEQEEQAVQALSEVLQQDPPSVFALDLLDDTRVPIAAQATFPFTVVAVAGVEAPNCNVVSQRAALSLAQLKDESLARLKCREMGYQNFEAAYFQSATYFYKSPKCFASAPMVVTSCR